MKTLPNVAASLLAIAAMTATADGENTLRAKLTGYQEVPSVSTAASGSLVAVAAADQQSFHYELSFSGLQGNVLQSHIHFGQKSVNGSIIIWLCGTSANPGPVGTQTCPQSGTISGDIFATNVVAGATTQQIAAGEFAEILAAMRAGVAYANVHTTLSPGGEIRGQLRGHGTRKEDERDGGDHGGEHKH
jgi:CHRD domain